MNVEDEIRKIMVDIAKIDAQPMTHETLLNNIRMDSLDLVQIIVAIEKRFKIEIQDVDAQNFKTFGDVVSCVENKLKDKE